MPGKCLHLQLILYYWPGVNVAALMRVYTNLYNISQAPMWANIYRELVSMNAHLAHYGDVYNLPTDW